MSDKFNLAISKISTIHNWKEYLKYNPSLLETYIYMTHYVCIYVHRNKNKNWKYIGQPVNSGYIFCRIKGVFIYLIFAYLYFQIFLKLLIKIISIKLLCFFKFNCLGRDFPGAVSLVKDCSNSGQCILWGERCEGFYAEGLTGSTRS